MKSLITVLVAAIFAACSISAFSYSRIQFTGLYQKTLGGNVWLKVKNRTIDPAAFKGHYIKFYQDGKMMVVKVVNKPYCTSSKTAVFKLKPIKPKKGKSYTQVVRFGKGHTCVKVVKVK